MHCGRQRGNGEARQLCDGLIKAISQDAGPAAPCSSRSEVQNSEVRDCVIVAMMSSCSAVPISGSVQG